MSVKFSASLRNDILNLIETKLGSTPKLQLRTGNAPAGPDSTATGTLLVELTLPANWMADASAGSKGIAGSPWAGVAVAAGQPGHYRLLTSAGVAHVDGSVTEVGGGGDLQMDNLTLAVGQALSILSYTLLAGNG